MDTHLSNQTEWSDVYVVDGPEPTITYRTALAVYEESLIKGRFVGRGWNGAGFVNFYDGRLDLVQHPMPQAFWLEIDGQLLASDWEWVGFEKVQDARTHEASPRPYDVHTVVTLKHTGRPVVVKVHTGVDGTPVLTRWLEVTNTGVQPAALSAAFSWSGVLQKTNRWRLHLPDIKTPLYSVGYMTNTHWGNEGSFQWHDVPHAGYRIDGRYRRDRHRHPMFVLRNNATVEITVDWVNYAIDAAAEIGAEVFFIDASWYAPPNSNWWSTVGDWDVDRQRYRVTFDNTGGSCEMDGVALMTRGLTIRLAGPLTSELLLFEAM